MAPRTGWVWLATWSMLGCVSSADIDELHRQLTEIQRQVLYLQQQASSKDEISALGSQIGEQTDAFRRSAADMQVALEQLSTQIDELQANLADTDFRLNDLSQQIATTNQQLREARGGAGGIVPSALPPPSNPQQVYQASYNDYLRGSYDLAVLGFRQYLEAYPDTELSDNAAYWVGESLYSQGRYDQAIREFDRILARYPRSDKLASALLKKAYSHLQLGQRDQGVGQLRDVVRSYPGSDEANLARQRLRDLGVDVS
ncbi:MAG: tol-pal system protein YbgF [Thermoanaerobaculia bacterium]